MTQLSFGDEENKETADKQKAKSNLLSVRLSKEEVAERDSLGMGDKEYFNYKYRQQKNIPVVVSRNAPSNTDVATIRQTLEMEFENKRLKDQLAQFQAQTSQGLAGLGDLVKVEMEKYKHDQEFAKLKEDNQKYQAQIKELEEELEEIETDRDALFDKLKMVELAKEFGPHIARVAKGFHEKGISGALGELSASMNGIEETAALPEGEENLAKIKFATRFISLFPETEKQQQIMTLLAEMSAIPWLADKVQEYINALKKSTQTA